MLTVGNKVWYVYESGDCISVESGIVTKIGDRLSNGRSWPYVILDNKLTMSRKSVHTSIVSATEEIEKRLYKKRKNNL